MKKRIIIEGMCCKNCAKHVKEALENVDGVKKAKVSLKKGEALVNLKENVNDEDLRYAIDEKEYKVTGIETL
ncbi:MAG TPA: cation transporter [Bacilli bacterium]